MNRLEYEKDYDAAQAQANIVLALAPERPDTEKENAVKALRVLLTCYNRQNNYQDIISLFESHQEIGRTDNNCKDLYDKAKRIQIHEKKNDMIAKIKEYLDKIEREIRTIVMSSLENNEQCLFSLLRTKNKEHWQTEWKRKEQIREQRLLPSLNIISYSTFGQLKDIFMWCKPNIISYKNQNSTQINRKHKQIIDILNIGDLLEERNESSHSLLYDRSLEDLEDIRALMRSLTRHVSTLKQLMGLN